MFLNALKNQHLILKLGRHFLNICICITKHVCFALQLKKNPVGSQQYWKLPNVGRCQD